MAAQLAVVDKYSAVLDSEHIVAAAKQPHIAQVAANQVELAEQVRRIFSSALSLACLISGSITRRRNLNVVENVQRIHGMHQ